MMALLPSGATVFLKEKVGLFLMARALLYSIAGKGMEGRLSVLEWASGEVPHGVLGAFFY
jgi:hypothetical protein